MINPLPKLSSIPFAALRDELATVLSLLMYRGQSFVVTRRGKPCALLLPLDVAEKLALNLEDLAEYKAKDI